MATATWTRIGSLRSLSQQSRSTGESVRGLSRTLSNWKTGRDQDGSSFGREPHCTTLAQGSDPLPLTGTLEKLPDGITAEILPPNCDGQQIDWDWAV